MWAKHNAEHCTCTTPLSRLLPHSQFPSWSGAAQGLARCRLWSSAGEGLREAWMPETDFYPERLPPLSQLTLLESPQALAAAVACTVKGKEWIWYWKTLWLFSYHHADTKNEFFISVFRGSTQVFVSLVFAGIIKASLESSIEGCTVKVVDLPSATRNCTPARLFSEFSNQWGRCCKSCTYIHNQFLQESIWNRGEHTVQRKMKC